MAFKLPTYTHPDFTTPALAAAPNVQYAPAPADGVFPDGFHSTSMYPEYFKIDENWLLAKKSRMDCGVVLCEDGTLKATEMHNIKQGELVVLGRTEQGEDGIYMHCNGFVPRKASAGNGAGNGGCSATADPAEEAAAEQFVFRQGRSRETSYARDYDQLIALLKHEKENGGNVLWVMGPAFAFDADARHAMESIVEHGYAQGILAGNALATHDLEGALLHTALGQDIYTQRAHPNGHYHHLDVLNKARRSGSIAQFIADYNLNDGIMCSAVRNDVPYVLTGSIRDDGPLPGVIGNAYEGQIAMRGLAQKATTVICLATMLHTIATGNMTPSFCEGADGDIRPVYLYTVDIDEFVVNKLLDRGSLSATTIVTNVQDFITIIAKGLDIF